MNVICVDDEKKIMEHTVSVCRKMPEIDTAEGFIHASDALGYMDDNIVDIALVDVNMPDMNGIELAAKIKKKSPDTRVIFLTGYSEYAVDAFKVRASGYLLKPFTEKQLSEEIKYSIADRGSNDVSHVEAKTFGDLIFLSMESW